MPALALPSDVLPGFGVVNLFGIPRTATVFSRIATAFTRLLSSPATSSSCRTTHPSPLCRRSLSASSGVTLSEKPSICTADELHYAEVSNSDWLLALWRYLPPPQAQVRNHPLLLLSGVGTNAIGYDLSPNSSFARSMSENGFDTWILEVRGAGLSIQRSKSNDIKHSPGDGSPHMEAVAKNVNDEASFTEDGPEKMLNHQPCGFEISLSKKHPARRVAVIWDESKLVAKLTEVFICLSERLSGFLSEGQSKIIFAKCFNQMSKLLEDSPLSERFTVMRKKIMRLLEIRQHAGGVGSQIQGLNDDGLMGIIEKGQRSPLFYFQERLSSLLEDFQKQLDLTVKYDWDFDNYLQEDVPAAIEYVRAESKPRDGKLFAIGHSMGGILLYAMISQCGCEGRDSGLAAIVTLASSLDYTSSKSRLKMLVPFADPAHALNVPAVPLGSLLSAAYPLSSRPPYVLGWLNHMISADNMMHPDLLKRLVLNNFCTIPFKLILQLTSAFREGGLHDRKGHFFYKCHLDKSVVPVLALAGDQDLICPPEAVRETVRLIPKHLVTFKMFGEPRGPHYAHYDLVGGRLAMKQVYPCIVEFLARHDSI